MDKVAVVTGSTKGIGKALTDSLLKDGWEIYGIARSELEEFASKPRYHHLKFDLSQPVNLPDLVEMLPPKIDLLVNNAGTWEVKEVADVSLMHLEDTFNLNLFTPILLTKLLLSRFSDVGMIINISTIMSMLIDKGFSLYCASKAGLDRFTTTLAKERPNLKVIGVLPSATDTPQGQEKALPGDDPKTMLTSEEVAAVVMQAVTGKFASGELVVVVNNEMASWWEGRDKYKLVNVDENKE